MMEYQKKMYKIMNTITDEMLKQKLTFEKLSNKAGVSITCIYNIVNKFSVPKIDTIILLADALDLDIKLTRKKEK